MKIAIVGLGLMGGSYAIGLTKKGYTVYGIDQNPGAIEYALNQKMIVQGSTDPSELLKLADVVVLAIYPQAILQFLRTYQGIWQNHQIITDICGVKSSFLAEATKLACPATYLSHHPMAGREKIGITYADDSIFKGANFLITPLENTPHEAIAVLQEIGRDLGFGNISIVSPKRHDEMVGFTSQLTHAIAVSLVNSDHDEETGHYIGDSYRDLTRIAMINETLWSELFLENKEVLLKHIESFEQELDLLKKALNEEDSKALEELFIKATKIRKKMEKCVN